MVLGGLVLGGLDFGGGEGGHFHPLLGVLFVKEGLPFALHRQDYYQANKCESWLFGLRWRRYMDSLCHILSHNLFTGAFTFFFEKNTSVFDHAQAQKNIHLAWIDL